MENEQNFNSPLTENFGKISHKQSCIDALLMLTERIASNQSQEQLFQLYLGTLKEKFFYSKILFIYKDQSNWFTIENSQTRHLEDSDLLVLLSNFTELTYMPEVETRIGEYDTIVPVIYEGYPIAYSLIAGVYNKVIDSVEEELRFLQAYTNLAVIAVENQRLIKQEIVLEEKQKDLQSAVAMQNSLVRSDFTDLGENRFDAVYIPHSMIGGDGYDIILKEDTNITFYLTIADVAGNGVPAALLMAHFQSILRSEIKYNRSATEFAKLINAAVYKVTKGAKFISVFVAAVDADARKIDYLNFGHNPPFLFSGGEVKMLDIGSTIIGVFPELPFLNTGTISYEKDSILFCCTDGFMDVLNNARDGEGTEFLSHFIQGGRFDSPKEFNEELLTLIEEHKGKDGYSDDVTFLTTFLA